MGNLLPFATSVMAALLSIEPFHLGGYAPLTPAFTLMTAYHWTLYRPDLLPALALFIIGTSQDLLSGELPGVTAVTLLLGRRVILAHRHYFVDRSFPFVWGGFSLLAGAAMLFLWALHSLLGGQLLGLRGPALQAVLTISIFPIASFLLGRTQRAMIGAD
jgi:rod shape-determining protein MreD